MNTINCGLGKRNRETAAVAIFRSNNDEVRRYYGTPESYGAYWAGEQTRIDILPISMRGPGLTKTRERSLNEEPLSKLRIAA